MYLSDEGQGKVCKSCGRHLPLSEYHDVRDNGKTYKRGDCKECRCRYSREHRKKNPDSYTPKAPGYSSRTSKAWRVANPDRVRSYYEKHRDRWRSYSHNRRARGASLPAEVYDRRDIFTRDGWVCQLCGESVPLVTLWPHPLSPSVDHVIPLSNPESPGDVKSNVQLAHLNCNLSKGAS